MSQAPEFPPYVPFPLLRNAHLMTLATQLPRRRLAHVAPSVGRREFQPLEDTRVVGYCNWQPSPREAPTLVLVHGLAGHADSFYMLGAADKAYELGFNTLRLNVRNCGGTEHLTPRPYHSGMTEDLHFVLRELMHKDGLERIYFAGFSLGGNMVFKMAGELGEDAPPAFAGIVGVSPALDLAPCAVALDEDLTNRLYRDNFLKSLKGKVADKARLFPDRYDPTGLDEVTSLREFDDAFTAPINGFEGYADYHARASAMPYVPRIAVPGLILTSRDDSLIPYAQFERPEVLEHPHLAFHPTEKGGHCSFIGWQPGEADGFRDLDRYWAENRLVQFLLAIEAEAKVRT